ncbi:hormogonium polysaccharide biosynthesis protein HpsA [Microcoleus sp. herbarium12]|uniref:hormogonium polysaccharide biosynthesis protein HpsA n=1 Tax=Microcoleus sp. herbarium12 TaxID=3055437 RepID=UPI002FD56FD8
MFKSKLSKIIVSLLRRIAGVTRSGAKRLMRAMLQALMAMGRRARLPVAGFVLPTVTMVLLVVILLTVAITLRSFDRANTARNVRVNQQVLAAATPALDRAKAKIQFMLKEDPQRPTATPSDNEMYRMISAADSPKDNIYTFGDETRLKLKYDLDGKNGINPELKFTDPLFSEKNESINTAWRYAVDTDNNGKFDTFTLYGIYFRSPERKTDKPDAGTFLRARQPLEARTPPMTGKISDPKCAAAAGTSASLVGDSGWYKSEGKLKKSFFVYTVNLPITNPNPANNEEAFKGTPSFSALEYQQDQSRIPLSNNAVVYEDDLEISAGVDFRVNGRIFTNSNLLATTGKTLKLFQVSSPKSCFYEQENSKIIVSGNVVNAGVLTGANTVNVDLFTPGATPTTTAISSSSTNDRLDVLYDNQKYSQRLSDLVDSWIASTTTPGAPPISAPVAADPESVQQLTKGPDFVTTRRRALEGYFKARMRKVPFGDTTTAPSRITQGAGDTLSPATEWNLLNKTDTAVKGSLAGPNGITLVNLPARNPKPEEPTDEKLLGERIQVGNNLPEQRWDTTTTPPKFIGLEPPQTIAGSKWQDDKGADTGTEERTRTPRVTQLADVGSTDRAGFWELAAAQAPKTAVDGVGGLRVVTGGGVYERVNSFLPPPGWDDPRTPGVEALPTYDDPATGTPTTIVEKYDIVWPDTMPMSPVLGVQRVYNNATTPGAWEPNPLAALPALGGSIIDPRTPKYAKGDLRMRATAVYHYADNAYDPDKPNPGQTPIGCISSYYDPSSSLTSRNLSSLANVSGDTLLTVPPRDAIIGSNNGVVYGPPTTARPGGASAPNPTTGLLGGPSPSPLEKQANYVFPNGRFANGPLRNALIKDPAKRTLADIAAIDSTMCAFGILATPGFALGTKPGIDDGAIKEVAFLNARDIKAIDGNYYDPATNLPTTVDETFTLSSPLTGTNAAKLSRKYDLALEERQPLEIRATVLDIDKLRRKTIPLAASIPGPSPEYLLPNSGIIYATRDDALPDRSDRQETSLGSGVFDEDTSKTVSPTDSRLDPTRRPNAIMLINGDKLFRGGNTAATVTTVEEVVKEKGLTLVSNLPVYIKGEFNKHTQEEFSDANLAADWNNFYTRNELNGSFACRKGDPRLTCAGDDWRPATVLGDAVTILSGTFREGFRNEGDFDLRNNAGGATFATTTIPSLPATELRRNQGFYNNNFVTNGLSSGAFNLSGVLDGTGTKLTDNSYLTIGGNGLNSSYFNNFVTPIQRRGNYPEYLMEVCTKLPVSACTEGDWYVNPTAGTLARSAIGQPYGIANHPAGTTAQPPAPSLQRFPRRVAFQRLASNTLQNADDTKVTALGIRSGNIAPFDTSTGAVPSVNPNSLWFASATNPAESPDFGNTNPLFFLNKVSLPPNPATDGFPFTDGIKKPARFSTASDLNKQPLLMPVLQIQATNISPGTTPSYGGGTLADKQTKWLPPAGATSASPAGFATATSQEFNLIVGSGDVPSRKIPATNTGEFNGGLQNLPRFLENWRDGDISTKIVGAFIQLNRSAYSTAPYFSRLGSSLPSSVFYRTSTTTTTTPDPFNRYVTSNAGGSVPFFSPPTRNWGFDVGLLSQPPDLFTQRFTTPSTQTKPAEYFREVPRNDDWIQTLMCAFIDKTPTTQAVSSDLRPTDSFCKKHTDI